MYKMIAMAAAASLLLAGNAIAETHTVKQDGTADFLSINDAYNSPGFGCGDTIHVLDTATYPGIVWNGPGQMEGFHLLGTEGGAAHTKEGITFSPGTTILSSSGLCLDTTNTYWNGPPSCAFYKIENCFIQNATSLEDAMATSHDGGIHVTGGVTVKLENCCVRYCSAPWDGGGAVVDANATLMLDNTWFAGNHVPLANHGSAIYVVHDHAEGNLNILNSLFCANWYGANVYECGIYPPRSMPLGSYCEQYCMGGDMNGDNILDIQDVRLLQGAAGLCYTDNNGDGDIDIDDLLNVIEDWGDSCTP